MLSFNFQALEEILNENEVWLCAAMRGAEAFAGCLAGCWHGASFAGERGEDIHLVLHVAGTLGCLNLSISIACRTAVPALPVSLEMACLNGSNSKHGAALQLSPIVLRLDVTQQRASEPCRAPGPAQDGT